MVKRSLLFLSFALPFLMMSLVCTVTRGAGTSQPVGAFDQNGETWIFLISCFYGFSCLIFFLPLLDLKGHGKAKYLLIIFAVWLLSLDRRRSIDGSETIIDKSISSLGYGLSLLAPPIPQDTPLPPGYVFVIPPESRIHARSPEGLLTITTGKGLLRSYTWDGGTRSLELRPGPNRSLVYPQVVMVDRFPGHDWKALNGITRFSGEEQTRGFQSTDDAAAWIKVQRGFSFAEALSKSGLWIMWRMDSARKELRVDVCQILINGKPAASLPHSSTSAISIEHIQPAG